MAYPRNSDTDAEDAADIIDADTLTQHVARLQKLQNERKQASERITEARAEAAEAGIDSVVLGMIMRLAKMDADDRQVFLFRLSKYAALLRYQ